MRSFKICHIIVSLVARRFLIGLLVMGLWECGKQNEEQKQNDAVSFQELELSDLSNHLKKEEIERIVQDLPAPSEIPSLLRKTGAGFNPGLPNTLDRIDAYRSTNFKASLNLGIYAADIGYLCSYGKSQDALLYLEGSRLLADNLRVTTAFDVEFLREFEDSIGSPDYLLELIDRSIDQVSKYLRTEDRTNLAILVLSGGFVEGLYLTSNLMMLYSPIENSDPSAHQIYAQVIEVANEQQEHLDTLLDLLATLESGSELEEFVQQLEKLNQSLQKFQTDSNPKMEWLRELNQQAFDIRSDIIS